MSKQTILTAIRRGLKRGKLPADQQVMLQGRLAAHPRHLIPARSRLPHPEQVDLFVRNVEKEFGTVVRVADLDAVPGAVADYLAAQNLPGRVVMAPHPELTDQQIADVLTYVRNSFGNKATAVTAAQVKTVRAANKPAN